MRSIRVFLVAALCALPLTAVDIDSNTFGGLEARSIGPATMSGRVAAIDAIGEDPLTIYVGAASGGVWKSDDGGVTYEPVFDDHVQSVGAIRIDPSNTETVWVGTGEGWTRNSVSIGDGVYKTTDGGENWTHMGLEESERITRIQVDPNDSDTVFVCVTGHLWSANEERGVYRTKDGGETWEQMLAVDENTGCSDLAIDPGDANILYAGMWQFRRYPDFFESGGPGSGLYRSMDGGDTWEELTNGLPEGEKGRIAVAVAPSRPNVVYAVVESENTALYRSNNLGESWEEMNTSFAVQGRPFYFAYLVVDPNDHKRVYKPGFGLGISTDGGKSFGSMFGGGFFGSVHSDHHALWVNPHNSNEVILGTDGGVYISNDKAAHWRFVGALPISQFYQVSYDMDMPYNVYGGLQDNGTWMGPSRKVGGINNGDWQLIGQGDGFYGIVDPLDPDYVYVESQGGNVVRYRRSTEEGQDVKPYPDEGAEELRFNWNTPIHASRSEAGTVYVGAQYLFRSHDRGETWERISPDLTTDDPARQRQKLSGGLSIDNSTAENNATIYSISESPLNPQLIWVGSDDGLVHVTRDGGETWENVTANIPGLPEGLWVSEIDASNHEEGLAYVTIDGHRSGDKATYVYRTRDFGATWESIATDQIESFAHVVREDPENPNLLFVGTEFGLYVSIDGGEQWARFEGNLPQVPVRDLAIHPREHDLIIATHGRGIYILDDLTPLRALTAEVLESEVALLPSRQYRMTTGGGFGWFNGDAEFVGSSPPQAASIYYYQKKRHIFGDLKVEVYAEDGELLATLPGGKRRGLNRVDWPTRLKPPKLPPASNLVFAFQGPTLPEGDYDFKLTKGKTTLDGTVSLAADPNSPHSAEDRALQQETALEIYHRLADLTYLVETLVELRDQADERAEAASRRSVKRAAEEYATSIDEFRGSIVSTADAGWLSGDEKLREHLGNLFGAIVNYEGRPTNTQLARAEKLLGELEVAEERFATLSGADLDGVNSRLTGAGMDPITFTSREEWDAEDSKDTSGSLALGRVLKAKEMQAVGEWLVERLAF
jgi:photosystem II stability/assembly factor-like uncharacterized protein